MARPGIGTWWGGERGGSGFIMDPTTYGQGFTNLNQGWNQNFLDQYGMGAGGLGGELLGQGPTGYGGFMGQAGSMLQSMPGVWANMPRGLNESGINSALANLASGTQTGLAGIQGQINNLSGLQNYGASLGNKLSGGAMNEFLSFAPQLQALAMGSTSGLERGMQDTMKRFTGETVANTGAEFAGMGSLYSSGLGDISGQRIGERSADMAGQLAGKQADIAAGLWGQGMGNIFQGTQMGAQLGLQGMQSTGQLGMQGALGMGQLGLDANSQALAAQQWMAGQNASLGQNAASLQQQGLLGGAGLYGQWGGNALQGGLGLQQGLMGLGNEWVAPSTQYNPTWLEEWGPRIGGALQGSLSGSFQGLAAGGPWGAVGGGTVGGVGGFFGGQTGNYGGGGQSGGGLPDWLTSLLSQRR